MPKPPKLKRCNCGQPGYVENDIERRSYWINCTGCDNEGPKKKRPVSAVRAWNEEVGQKNKKPYNTADKIPNRVIIDRLIEYEPGSEPKDELHDPGHLGTELLRRLK